jgi:hypothetical protein
VSLELPSFLEAYDAHRVEDQRGFYEKRSDEYARSALQTSSVSEVLLLLAAVCGVVAAFWNDQAVWLGVLAAAFAAFAAAVASWAEVVGFSANAELYKAASAGLAQVRPRRPDPPVASAESVRTYFDQVEDILLGEVRTWSQKWAASPSPPNSGTTTTGASG